MGSDTYLREITETVDIPVLRKDFTVDKYMIYQAKAFGASALLLICAILNDQELLEYRELAETLGMDALVEAHDENEVARALKTGAKIVGVNNRDLKTFKVDMNNSIRLRNLAPDNVVFVSESGIKNAGDGKDGNKAEGTTTSDKATQAFVNNKGGEIDTGINLTTLPYILVFAGVIVIAGAVFITRRRKYED